MRKSHHLEKLFNHINNVGYISKDEELLCFEYEILFIASCLNTWSQVGCLGKFGNFWSFAGGNVSLWVAWRLNSMAQFLLSFYFLNIDAIRLVAFLTYCSAFLPQWTVLPWTLRQNKLVLPKLLYVFYYSKEKYKQKRFITLFHFL